MGAMSADWESRSSEGALELPLPFGVLQWKNLRSVSFKLGSKPKAIVYECSDSRLLDDGLGTSTGYCLTDRSLLCSNHRTLVI